MTAMIAAVFGAGFALGFIVGVAAMIRCTSGALDKADDAVMRADDDGLGRP